MCGHAWHDRMPVVGAPDFNGFQTFALGSLLRALWVFWLKKDQAFKKTRCVLLSDVFCVHQQ